jgi:hypothetical protein
LGISPLLSPEGTPISVSVWQAEHGLAMSISSVVSSAGHGCLLCVCGQVVSALSEREKEGRRAEQEERRATQEENERVGPLFFFCHAQYTCLHANPLDYG